MTVGTPLASPKPPAAATGTPPKKRRTGCVLAAWPTNHGGSSGALPIEVTLSRQYPRVACSRPILVWDSPLGLLPSRVLNIVATPRTDVCNAGGMEDLERTDFEGRNATYCVAMIRRAVDTIGVIDLLAVRTEMGEADIITFYIVSFGGSNSVYVFVTGLIIREFGVKYLLTALLEDTIHVAVRERGYGDAHLGQMICLTRR
ncbi:hypothetical protein BJY52DRAFT_1222034 [Lactarius psammicola]|nr:hypothetical protein BJY52DRAFT_1222034 [Lactarius psammicola]